MNSTARENKKLRVKKKTLEAAVAYFSGVASACLIMMWSVFNLWYNVLSYRAAPPEPAQNWSLAAIIVVVTCVVPFFVGFWLLQATMKKYRRPQL